MGHYAGLKPVFKLLNFKNWDGGSVFSVLAGLCSFLGPMLKDTNLVSWCVLWVVKGGVTLALAGQPTLPTW